MKTLNGHFTKNGNHTDHKHNGCHHHHNDLDLELIEHIGDNHHITSIDTPLRQDAFDLDDETKIALIEEHFAEIMNIMGLDLTDDSLKGTPRRVAKMYIKEIFSGLNPANKPAITLFDNKYDYHEMLIEKDITVHSNCEHHFVPIIGKAHVAYIPRKKVIGLSKINRLVQFFSKRPQVQERLTVQIAQELRKALQTPDVAVIIEADHACVMMRGVQDCGSSTITAQYLGAFERPEVKNELLRLLGK
ncbi:MAG TPA: GTP cyclohydrolase I FolE [Chitinophagales bacterium]|nr:GTP cyclohydrolase I FolE [Chitinophagales bacterium]